MKSIILYGLMAVAHASPVPAPEVSELSKRAKLGDFICPDGKRLSENDVRQALHECRRHDDGQVGKYPAFFGNKNSDQKVFSNIPDGTDLREFPIVEGGVYTGGETSQRPRHHLVGKRLTYSSEIGPPGKYRVVTDYKDNRGDFRGVMQHTGAAVGGAYEACTRATDTKRDDGDKEKDNKDKNNKDKDNKDKEKSVRDASPLSVPSHDVSELTTRAKKKKIGSATCSDGVTLSKDDVWNAFKECKTHDDYAVGSYPHKFGNSSGGGQVFEGVTKDLREYPIIQGGTWTGKWFCRAPFPFHFVLSERS